MQLVQGRRHPARTRRGAFTLVELLVVVAIIGILVSLLLPAAQYAREAARRVQCGNNVSQMGKGVQNYLGSRKYFPSGGWGYLWVGNPDRDPGKMQPGSWCYSLLPFIGEDVLYGRGNEVGATAAQKSAASAKRIQTPISTFVCPTRRGVRTYPVVSGTWPHSATPKLTDTVSEVARSDYAANGGSVITPYGSGPDSLAAGDSTYTWPVVSSSNGVVTQRSEVSDGQIPDGLSNTIFVGEKYLNPDNYLTGQDNGDNESLYHGDDYDNTRWGGTLPERDRAGITYTDRFGSSHNSGFYVVMCGSETRWIGYDVDPIVFSNACNRRDRSGSQLP